MMNGASKNPLAAALTNAAETAKSRGHSMTDFRTNKKMDSPNTTVVIASCMKCLCNAVVRSDGTAFGVALEYPCDPLALDKRLELIPASAAPIIEANEAAPKKNKKV